jgi:AcrR family transcriptional regulator
VTTTTDWLNEQRQELAVDRLMEAAREVFARDGIQGARMANLAKTAGCARATLYRYFPNKEALLHAYMVRVANDFGKVLDERLRGLRSFGDRLVEAVATSVELIQEREDVTPFFNQEGLGLTAQLTSNAAALREQLARQIDAESRSDRIEGKLRAEVSSREAADWLTRVIFSFSVLPAEAGSGVAFRKYLKKMLIPALVAQ